MHALASALEKRWIFDRWSLSELVKYPNLASLFYSVLASFLVSIGRLNSMFCKYTITSTSCYPRLRYCIFTIHIQYTPVHIISRLVLCMVRLLIQPLPSSGNDRPESKTCKEIDRPLSLHSLALGSEQGFPGHLMLANIN